MNFGISRNGRAAQSEGRAPASITAKSIGCGITAHWIANHCHSCEWHHSQANLGGDGRPTAYYCRENVLSDWLLANFAARNSVAAARKRLKKLVAIARQWGVEIWLGDQPKALPKKLVVTEEFIGDDVRITKREYTRSRGAYWPSEVAIRASGAKWRGDWLVWENGRAKRSSVISVAVLTADDLAAEARERARQELEAAQRRAAANEARLRDEEFIASRPARRQQQIELLIAKFRQSPSEGRANALRLYGFTNENINQFSKDDPIF